MERLRSYQGIMACRSLCIRTSDIHNGLYLSFTVVLLLFLLILLLLLLMVLLLLSASRPIKSVRQRWLEINEKRMAYQVHASEALRNVRATVLSRHHQRLTCNVIGWVTVTFAN